MNKTTKSCLRANDTDIQRLWARAGVILVTPALQWRKGRFAKAYRSFINEQRDIAFVLRKRKTAIDPIFDLIAKLLGTNAKHKQVVRKDLPMYEHILA